MLQTIDFNEQLKTNIIQLETECKQLCDRMESKYNQRFKELDVILLVDLVRVKKGKVASVTEVFEEDYESYIEIGIEEDDEFFPNAYIPIWKCKSEWFQLIGYLSECPIENIEKKIDQILVDMYEEHRKVE